MCFCDSVSKFGGFKNKKGKVGKYQEKAKSERYFHCNTRVGKNLNQQSDTDTMKTYRKPNEQLFSQKVATQLP